MNPAIPPPLPSETTVAPPSECSLCKSPNLSSQTLLLVCDPCRLSLVRHPYPWWVKTAALLVLVLVIVALAMTPQHWQEALAFSRAEKLTSQHRWQEAYEAYKFMELKGRHDTDLQLSYAEAAAYSGHYREAAEVLNGLSGKQASDSQIHKADSIDQELQRVVRLQSPPAASSTGRPPLR